MLQDIGRQRRLTRLVPHTSAALWLPLDDGLISGPEDHLRDLRQFLTRDVVEPVTAILGFRGALRSCHRELARTPTIMNLTASTTLGEHTRKVVVGRVADAVRDGADAVACHVNVTSAYEGEQLEILGRLVSEADAYGMPVIAMAYPRGRHPDGTDDNHLGLRERDPEEFAVLVRHGVRAAVELGASAVKTIYTGTVESFRTVVECAMDVPVLIAGEKLIDEGEAMAKAQYAIRAGAAGVAFGRQIFARREPGPFVQKLRTGMDDCWAERNRTVTSVPPRSSALLGGG